MKSKAFGVLFFWVQVVGFALPQVGDTLEFTKEIYVYPQAGAAFVTATEGVKEFLVIRQCDVQLLNRKEGEDRIPASTVDVPRKYEVTKVMEFVGYPLYRIQRGYKFYLKPLFVAVDNRIEFLVCLKESHEEHPPEQEAFTEEDLILAGPFMKLFHP